MQDYCWKITDKYKHVGNIRDLVINNLKGKLSEEVVKARLGNFITEVDYELTASPPSGISNSYRFLPLGHDFCLLQG